MHRKFSWVAALGAFGLGALVTGPLAAEEIASAACSETIAPTAELAPWSATIGLEAAGSTSSMPRSRLAIGQAARLTLLPAAEVRYPVSPGKPGGSVSYGGLVEIEVREAGTYRVAVASAAWIDIIREREPVTSIAHGHGPDCSGIRKMVTFPLAPGRYTLQISANSEPQTTVLVVRIP